MSNRRDDDFLDTLRETQRLVGDVEASAGDAFSLDDILAEFGQDAAKPAPKQETAESVPEKQPEPASAQASEQPDEAPRTDAPRHRVAPKEEKPRRNRRNAPVRKTEEPPMEAAHLERQEPYADDVDDEPQPSPRLSVEDVMAQTVSAVLEEEEDSALRERIPLREHLGFFWVNVKEKGQELLAQFVPAKKAVPGGREEPICREPDMEQAMREAERRCKRLRRQLWPALIPVVLLLAVTVLETWLTEYVPTVWTETVLLRCCVVGGLLLLTALLALDVWREALRELKKRNMTCEAAAILPVLSVLGECVYGAVTGRMDYLPPAATAALLVWLCLLGQLLLSRAKYEAFRLAELGGRPPYAVSMTAAGACKQKGHTEGFYTAFHKPDPAVVSQRILLPLLLSVCTVLTGVICIGGERTEELLRVWSALLTSSLSLGLPLCGGLSVYCMQNRLSRSACAVAGYAGARAVGDSKRMVLTDSDIFPPGTVIPHGLKTFGEETSRAISYAATAARAAGSPLQTVFEQLMAEEGGTYCVCEDLQFYEEGGVGINIRGESVLMGSEYFMKKRGVRLPRETKVKTGVFLAVDGQLAAIFAIKYQPMRNVEWGLRTLRRTRMEPVLAMRSFHITPEMLKKSFSVRFKAIYPDISTRLALSDLSGETAPRANAILYREGLMSFAETVIGSRRCCRLVRLSTVLCWVGSLCGLLLSYYLAGMAAYGALNAGYMLAFGLLWLLPAVLLGDMTRRY